MLRRLVAYLLGYLRIEVRGGHIERFLNLSVEEGLTLWGIERTPDRMRVTLTIRDFRRLRRVVRKSRGRVHILRRHGFPFLAARLQRRPVLVAGALACLAFLFWASAHVWVVRVKISGPQNLDPRAVLAVAAEAGLKPGAWKSHVDKDKVQAHIQSRIGEVSIAVIRMQGTRAVIEVVEKAAERSLPSQGACVNLVARKSGVIEEVIPFQGEPLVKKGDIVKAGDVLVDCTFRFYPGGRPQVYPGTPLPPREGVARSGVAQAKVMARVSYQEYQEVPLFRDIRTSTGAAQTRWVLNWRGKPILQTRTGSYPFSSYEEQRRVYGLQVGRIWRSPVELVTVRAEEVRVEREAIPLQQAVDAARSQMSDRLRWVLGPSDRVLSPLKAEVVDRGSEYAGLRLSIETLEEISEPAAGVPPQPAPAEPPAANHP